MQPKSKTREYIEAIVTAGLLALAIRSFVIEAFKIPSSSMVPTLLVGDHLFVNKFVYGLRVPFTKHWIARFRLPHRGEVVVFIYPREESKDFIKRVVGLPGDLVRVVGRDVYVNGELLHKAMRPIDGVPTDEAAHLDYFLESTDGIAHYVQHDKLFVREGGEYTVPTGHLFVMGDNRDGSADSRDWGFVPLGNLKGKAMFIWLSWDGEGKRIRWERFGRWIR
ncbi:MAG: signal peptidase I [Deltaproteobacteria bacterium]|nr:signal peptidase I [Deltaproteobacteria bacterium]